jgi:hypothetical protein
MVAMVVRVEVFTCVETTIIGRCCT